MLAVPSDVGARALHFLGVLLLVAFSHSWALAQTPLPPHGGRSVHDLAGVLSPAQEQKMESLHTELLRVTGVALVVVTIPRLENETIDQFALRVGEGWGVGKAGQDLGVVVAFASHDRQIFVATGYGVEPFLPDGRVGRMIDNYAMPSFREGKIAQGLYLLSAGIAQASADEFEVTLGDLPRLPPLSDAPSVGTKEVIVGIAMALLIAYLAWRHPGLLWILILLAFRSRGSMGGGGFGGGGFGGGGFGGGGSGRNF